jgi:hypothetical protein
LLTSCRRILKQSRKLAESPLRSHSPISCYSPSSDPLNL